MLTLMKYNYYKTIVNLRVFLMIILIYGVAIVLLDKSRVNLLNFATFTTFGMATGIVVSLEFTGGKNFERQILCLPIKKSDIVKSVYLFNFIIALFAIVVVFTVGTLSVLYNKQDIYLYLGDFFLLSILTGTTVLIINSIYHPLSYILTTKFKLFVIMITSAITFSIYYNVLYFIRDKYFESDLSTLILLGITIIAIVLAVYGASYFLSSKLFERKNIEDYINI